MVERLHVAVNGWYVGSQGAGSGQYVDRLLNAMAYADDMVQWSVVVPQGLDASFPPAIKVVEKSLPRLPRQLQKLWWEQVSVPQAAKTLGAQVLWVPYWAAPWWQPVQTVVTVHDLIPLLLPENRGGWLNRAYTRLVARTAKKCSKIIAVSHASKRDIVAHLRVPEEKVHVVWHGPNLESAAIPTAEQIGAVQQKHKLPQRYFLYLGGFEARKNLTGILHGYATYLQQGGSPEVKMVIAGRVPPEDSAFTPDPRGIAHGLGITSQVLFPGFVDEEDKPALYAGATAFLFPSRYEGFGMMVLEAMQFGSPVVTSAQKSQ